MIKKLRNSKIEDFTQLVILRVDLESEIMSDSLLLSLQCNVLVHISQSDLRLMNIFK